MSESFDISGSLFFVKDSLIQFVSSQKQNVTNRNFIRGKVFHNFPYSSLINMLKTESFKLKFLLDYKNTRVICKMEYDSLNFIITNINF